MGVFLIATWHMFRQPKSQERYYNLRVGVIDSYKKFSISSICFFSFFNKELKYFFIENKDNFFHKKIKNTS